MNTCNELHHESIPQFIEKESEMETKIRATLVRANQRLSFLPKHFGKRMIVAEREMYDTLGEFCASYNGGFWNFYELDNGGFYMAPHLDGVAWKNRQKRPVFKSPPKIQQI